MRFVDFRQVQQALARFRVRIGKHRRGRPRGPKRNRQQIVAVAQPGVAFRTNDFLFIPRIILCEARIEKAAYQMLTEAAALPDAFYERSGRSLQRMGTKLRAWNKGGAHAASLKRLQARLDGVCEALDAADPKRSNCESLLKPAPKTTA